MTQTIVLLRSGVVWHLDAEAKRAALDVEEAPVQHERKEGALSTAYVEQRDGLYRVSGSRVSLDSIVYAFISGHSAESIAQSFPVLTLEQVYGAIAFYLGHRDEVDRYLEAQQQNFDAKRAASRAADPMFYQKLADAKRHIPFAR